MDGSLAERLDVVLFAQRRLGFYPDAVQERVLRTCEPRVLLNCTRQWGKSTVTAVKALHYVWTHAGGLVLVAAPSARQSGELIRKVKGFAGMLGVKVTGGAAGIRRWRCRMEGAWWACRGTRGPYEGFRMPD